MKVSAKICMQLLVCNAASDSDAGSDTPPAPALELHAATRITASADGGGLTHRAEM